MKFKDRQNQLKKDLENMTDLELKKAYSLTNSSLLNLHQREKQGIAIISKELRNIRGFLSILGIRKNKNYTLDRINNDDPEYAVGKVRWANKTVQNNNRSNNIPLKHDDEREFNIAKWAEITNQKPSTLYKRKSSGWLDMEIITGKRIHFDTSIKTNPFPYKTRAKWDTRYSNHIVAGGGLSKLEFLWRELNNINPLSNEVLVIEALLIRRQGIDFICNCVEYCDGSCNYDYLDHIAEMDDKKLIKIAERYNGYSTDDLNSKLVEIKPFVEERESVLSQVNDMYKYKLNRQKAIDDKHESIDKTTVLKHFDELNPKPLYNINLPEISNLTGNKNQ